MEKMSNTHWDISKKAGEISMNALLILSVYDKEVGSIIEVMKCHCSPSNPDGSIHYVDILNNSYAKSSLEFL